ncbi:MAG TPA: HAD family hydrolase [Gemmatimonadaceae bacterium]|nr:HAD family hydrolase [Gemmatimonadaceae bacterium]
MSVAAAFLDRDGTLVEDVHYLARPEQLRLLPGVVEALRALAAAGVPAVIVTNQSGIARGLFTGEEYRAVERALEEMLRDAGVPVAATYHCPHHPDFSGPCACRKPGVELFERAARDLGLELGASLYVGDKWRDVAPALRFGGTGVLVPSPDTPPADVERAAREALVAASIDEAVSRFLARRRERPGTSVGTAR